MSNLLLVNDLLKTFGGITAVSDVSFSVPTNSITGLIGPNGAGKTTVFNLITGNYQPDSGEILFEGLPITKLSPYKIVTKGIARTFQNIRLFEQMTLLENVLAGCHCRMKSGLLSSILRLPSQRKEELDYIEKAMAELAFVGLDADYNNIASNLSYGNQRLLEIARALATSPKLLILDEPAGGMNEQETACLAELIQAIKKRGITILLVEHDINLVMQECDHLVVLEYGRVLAKGTPSYIQKHPEVIRAYLGTEEDE